jgi:hypothetical protein
VAKADLHPKPACGSGASVDIPCSLALAPIRWCWCQALMSARCAFDAASELQARQAGHARSQEYSLMPLAKDTELRSPQCARSRERRPLHPGADRSPPEASSVTVTGLDQRIGTIQARPTERS